MFGVRVDEDGPLFNGRAIEIFERYADDVEKHIAEYTLKGIKRHIHERFRHPTGRYEAHLNISRMGRGTEVNDRGIVYGPWLEGISRRNSTTRFRGYHSFEHASHEAEAKAGHIADDVFTPKWKMKLD
jgi:hypothetical protein